MKLMNKEIIPRCPKCLSTNYKTALKKSHCPDCNFKFVEPAESKIPSSFIWYSKEIEQYLNQVM
jgi:transposase-like protein